MVGGFIYFDTPIDTSVIEADIDALQSEMVTKVTQGGDNTGVFPLEVGTKTAQPFVITTNSLARIRVLANGRTLVQKTTDTGEALQVGGTAQADTVNSPNIGTTTAVDAKFCANNVEGLRIFNATRNVAINSALDAGFKLDINGTLRASAEARFLGRVLIGQQVGSGLFSSTAQISGLSSTNTSAGISFANFAGASRFSIGTQGGGNNRFGIYDDNANAWRLFIDGVTGNVLIGSTNIINNLILDVPSTTKAVRFAPMTTANRLLIVSPPEGSFLYDTDLKTYCFYDGTAWRKISHSLA